MKICKDGRIWGQNNKEAGDHLGILTRLKPYIKKGYNTNSAFKKGYTPWIKGEHHSQKTKKKIREIAKERGFGKWRLGKKHTQKTIEKQKQMKLGNKNPNWVKKIKINCLICGTPRIVTLSLLKNKKRGRFCSKTCAIVWRNAHQKNKATGIELKVEKYLKKLKLNYQSQKIISEGRTVADFYIPAQRIVIYCDGEYWHSKLETQQKDATQDLLLGMNGYKVVRLPGKIINNGSFKRKLRREVKI